MENQDKEREYHLLYKLTQYVAVKRGYKLKSFLGSTHCSIVGSTDSHHVKNCLIQTQNPRLSASPIQNSSKEHSRHRVRVTNNENTEITKKDFVVVKKVNLYFKSCAFYSRLL